MNSLIVRPNDVLDEVQAAVLNDVGAGSRPVYAGTIREFRAWATQNEHQGIYATLAAYKAYLSTQVSPQTTNRKMAAVRKFVRTAAQMGVIAPEQARQAAEVSNIKVQGERYGTRLNEKQSRLLLSGPDRSTLKGLRDYAILSVFLGTGLRRAEIASLTWEHIVLLDDVWIILNLVGKGNRTRTVPMHSSVKFALDAYAEALGEVSETDRLLGTERETSETDVIFVGINRHGQPGNEMTPHGVWYIVTQYAQMAGLDVKPHDLRRTYASLARKHGAELSEIQLLLGHASVETTQRYVGETLDFERASGFVNLGD